MIVAMKKIFLVTERKDARDTIAAIRKLGVLHVEHSNTPKGQELGLLNDELAILNQAILLLENVDRNLAPKQPSEIKSDWRVLAKHLIDLNKRYEQLREFSVTLKSRIDHLKPWGDFDYHDLLRLSTQGVVLRFYSLSQEDIKSLPQDLYIKKISRTGKFYNCVIISRGAVEIPFKEIELPRDSLSRMQKRLAEDSKTALSIRNEIINHFTYLKSLKAIKERMLKESEFYEAFLGMGKEGELSFIKGYIPFDVERQVKKSAHLQGWGVLITEPSPEDIVPTLVRNPAWIRIIEPVFKMIEVVPGYGELDISFWFLIFFSIFFGILIGDAGYGAVYFLLTLWAQKKFSKKVKDKAFFVLFYILSSCAIIWGVLTASFFGQEWVSSWFKPLLPSLRNDKSMQAICFFLGALHLSIAHCWKALLKFPNLVFLSDIGWIFILWLGFFFAKFLILGDNLPAYYLYLLYIGAFLVIFFSNPNKNIFKAFGSGIGAFILNLMNNFTDIVSYVRLFAVGLASVAVADTFNKMALGLGFNNFFTGLLTSVILLSGHLLNIVLGTLSIVVHGIRLNVLEFCSHLDIKWLGFNYKPLSEEKTF